MMIMRVRLVLSLLLLTAAVTAWTGLDGEESDYIENTAESQEAEEAHDDTGNGHIDDESDDDDDDGSDDGNDEDSDGDDDDNAGNDESEGNGDNEDSETDADVSAGDSETLEAEFVDPSQFVG